MVLFKKIVALAIVILMLFSITACTFGEQGTQETQSNGSAGSSLNEETDSESPFYGYDLPVKDFGGYEFKMLVADGGYGLEIYTVDEYSSSAIEQKIYERNQIIEERLNITMYSETVDYRQVRTSIETLCSTNTFEYDFFTLPMTAGMPYVIKGYMSPDTLMADYTDMSRVWWDDAAASQLATNGVNYTYIGDAVLHYFESMWVMAYNNDIAERIHLPNIAEVALEGDWTLEMLYNYSEEAYVDTDNSSSKTNGDVFGMTIPNTFVQAMLITSDESLLEYDEKNYPSFNGFSNRAVDIFDRITKDFYQNEKVFIGPRDNEVNGGDFHDVFLNGEALFYAEPMGSLQKLREATFDFTVIPLPKYDDESEYLTGIQRYSSSIYVPNTTPDYERTGIILENLMYQSYVNVRETYFESIASLQRVRNEDSYRVLKEIVFASDKRVSMALVYDFGGMGDSIIEYAFANKSLSTLGASLKRGLNAEIDKVLSAR